MSVCRSCGRPLHSGASFCSSCGEGQPHPDPFATVDERPTAAFAGSEQATILSKSREQDIISMQNTSLLEDKKLADEGTLLLPADLSTSEEEDEEKRKRRLALLGLAALGEGLSGGGNVTMPVVQGLPQVNQAPVVQGMPQIGSAPGGLGMQSGGSGAQPSLPGNFFDSPPGQAGSLPWRASPPAPAGNPDPQPTPPGSGSAPSTPLAPGCLTWLIIVLIPLLILGSFATAAYTFFGPTISLSGASSVSPGGSFILHGSGFLANTTISLTLDGNTPLSMTYHSSPSQTVNGDLASMLNRQAALASNTLTTNGGGQFSVSIRVGQDWKLGRHTIRATETVSFRSATTTFDVTSSQDGSPTPTDTAVPTATVTATVTPSPTSTTTPSQNGLTAITPGTVSLGPVLEGSSQPVSTQITLSTGGKELVPWTASWDQTQAPWLQLNLTSGQIQAPNNQQIRVQATPTGLAPNTYKTTVTFSSSQGPSILTLTVSLTVQSPCLTTTPPSLTFTGVANYSDPPAQTLSLNNCGLTSNWTGSVSTTSGGNWLSINPQNVSINGGWTQGVRVTASNRTYKLQAGTYQGTITFTSGTRKVTVRVTLNVLVPALLTASTAVVYSSSCKFNSNVPVPRYECPITLSSNKYTTPNLNWASSSATTGASSSPPSDLLKPGTSEPVTLLIPRTLCDQTVTVTFKGPYNSQQVTWQCDPVIG